MAPHPSFPSARNEVCSSPGFSHTRWLLLTASVPCVQEHARAQLQPVLTPRPRTLQTTMDAFVVSYKDNVKFARVSMRFTVVPALSLFVSACVPAVSGRTSFCCVFACFTTHAHGTPPRFQSRSHLLHH